MSEPSVGLTDVPSNPKLIFSVDELKRLLALIDESEIKIDPNASEADNIIHLINHTNNANYQSNHLSIGLPTPISIGENTVENRITKRNTKVIVEALKESGYQGEKPFFYRRIDVGLQFQLASNHQGMIYFEQEFTEENIRAFLQTVFTHRAESVNVFINSRQNHGKEHEVCIATLSAKENSLLYIGRIILVFYRSIRPVSTATAPATTSTGVAAVGDDAGTGRVEPAPDMPPPPPEEVPLAEPGTEGSTGPGGDDIEIGNQPTGTLVSNGEDSSENTTLEPETRDGSEESATQ